MRAGFRVAARQRTGPPVWPDRAIAVDIATSQGPKSSLVATRSFQTCSAVVAPRRGQVVDRTNLPGRVPVSAPFSKIGVPATSVAV